ncbi:TIGR03986 family CRISPR-associated RAMP protein [Frankia sp. Cas3]|uniref:TIGR03986 family type III CRISPR-associated RAMP protein n=1 Tax=Frankia sp. Cas3 TaxID=3073926 RepID=UPI002AD3C257|nr:TIGR03986 family CRISPR-associated RAMP protein [Frankia sp. Cas3]
MSSRFGTIAWKTTTDGARKIVINEDGAGERRFERRFLDETLTGLSDDDLAGRSVEFDWAGGRAKRIRDKGTAPTAQTPPPGAATTTPPEAARSTQTPARTASRQPPRHMAPARSARQATTAERQSAPPYRAPDPLNAFINPYGFVPAPQRDVSNQTPLGDVGHDPTDRERLPGHDRLRANRWSGTIGVTITVATPLLILDTAGVAPDNDGHATYDVLKRSVTVIDGQDGKKRAENRPHLPPTAVKGMLRSAYEAVTNSRFGVFTGHDSRLGYRMAARDGLTSIPARVVGDGVDAKIELLPGTTPAGHQGRHGSPMHAAWLPAYWTPEGSKHVRSDQSDFNIVMPDGARPEHGAEVRARIQLVQHHRWDRRSATHTPDFQLWWVRSLAEPGQKPPQAPLRTSRQNGASWYEPIGPEKVVDGWVCVTNRNIDRKHDERVFFYDADDDLRETFELNKGLRRIWHDIIHGYKNAHRPGELKDPDPENLEKKVSSRHLLLPDGAKPDALKDGDLLYVRLDARGEIDSLYPVTIARELFSVAPIDLLDRSLLPADSISELSPADRVFGWVRTEVRAEADNRAARDEADPAGAWRGSLRIGPVRCDQSWNSAVERFEGRGLPLAILGQPKPGQGRFYLGTNQAGQPVPLRAGLPKAAWFDSAAQMLRGRKVYPHHAGLPEGYWKNPTTDRTQKLDGGRYQEYRRPRNVPSDPKANPLNSDGTAFVTQHSGGVNDENRDDQNRSVNGWVRPGTTFTFTIDVRNITDVELGALLWLLDLGKNGGDDSGTSGSRGEAARFHRLGLGKPLGFGSVRLTLDPARTDLRTGESWTQYYRSLGPEQRPEDGYPAQARASVDAFKKAVSPGDQFEKVPHIKAFLAAATGDASVPVHYPRVRPNGLRVDVPVPPDPRGRSFEWFVQNEQQQGGRVRDNRGVSLPDLGAGHLPIHPEKDR